MTNPDKDLPGIIRCTETTCVFCNEDEVCDSGAPVEDIVPNDRNLCCWYNSEIV